MLGWLSESKKEELKKKLKESWQVPTSELIEKLASEIEESFWKKEANLISKESLIKLFELKETIWKSSNNTDFEEEVKKMSSSLSEQEKKDFYYAILWAKEVIKNSRDLTKEFKDEIHIFQPWKNDGFLANKIFWEKWINKWKNPWCKKDQIVWACIWLFNSGEAIAKISVQMLIWIWKSIPDTYLILAWKWEYNGFKGS